MFFNPSIVFLFFFIETTTFALRRRYDDEYKRGKKIPRNLVKQEGNSCFNDGNDRRIFVPKSSDRRQNFIRTECVLACDDIPLTSSLYPFVWSYCPSSPLHFKSVSDPNFKETLITFQPPFVGSMGIQKMKVWHYSRNNRNSELPTIPSYDSIGNGPAVITVDAVPAPGSLSSGSSFPLGTTQVTYYGTVNRNDCLDEMSDVGIKPSLISEKFNQYESHNLTVGSSPLICEFDVVIHDNVEPQFTFCPGNRDIRLKRGQTEITVKYDKPVAVDNSKKKPKIEQTRGVKNGEKVGPGRYQFEFVASDDEENKSFCRFQIKVIRNSGGDFIRTVEEYPDPTDLKKFVTRNKKSR